MRYVVTRAMVIVGVAVLAGCSFSFSAGGSDTIDPDWAERGVAQSLEKNYDLRVDSVTCPDGIEPAKGATFACTADIAGAQLPVRLTIGEVDLGTGTFQYKAEPTKVLLDVEAVVKGVKEELQGKVPDTPQVDCGAGPYQVVAVGDAMSCTVLVGEERVVVRAVVKDMDGKVRFEA